MPGDDSPSAATGTVLLGRYELGDLLGRGTSAKVYLARDLVTGQSVAMKSFPNPHSATSLSSLWPSSSRHLRHRHVVRLHEILAMRKKVHFALNLAADGELFSLLDSLGQDLPRQDLGGELFSLLDSYVLEFLALSYSSAGLLETASLGNLQYFQVWKQQVF
ncbi:unnamed protein product [Urochloa humidicola]